MDLDVRNLAVAITSNTNIEQIKLLLRSSTLDINSRLNIERIYHHFNAVYHFSDVVDTYLHLAIYMKKIDIVDLFIKKGADVNILNASKFTPLYYAVNKKQINIVRLLLENGADVNIANHENTTPLHKAVIDSNIDSSNINIVKLLLENGADVNIANHENFTPLHKAVIDRNINNVKLLLENGADVNIANHQNTTPLHKAVIERYIDIIKLLLEKGADPNILNAIKENTLHRAVTKNYGDNITNINIVRLLLENGANLNILNNKNYYPLHKAIEANDLDIIDLLLENGAHVNIRNEDIVDRRSYIYSPLFKAVKEGYINTVRLLIAYNADVNFIVKPLTDRFYSESILHCAVNHNQLDIVRLLLENGANPNIDIVDNEPVLSAAVGHNNINMVKLLIDNGTDVKTLNNPKYTPLLTAAAKLNIDMIRLLLENGANPNIENENENKDVPLLYVVKRRPLDDVIHQLDKQETIAILLIQYDANVNAVDTEGFTPLQYAVYYNLINTAKLLLEKGAHINDNIKKINIKSNDMKKLLSQYKNKDGQISTSMNQDITKLNNIFNTNPNSTSMCPACLEIVEDNGETMYISHTCIKVQNYKLYNKYKNVDIIQWCKICNIICTNNQHYKLIDYYSPKSVLLTSRFPQAKDCRINGGGGIVEKGQRFRRYLEYGNELHKSLGVDTINILTKEVWNAPLINNRALIEKILHDGKWDIKSHVAPVANRSCLGSSCSVQGGKRITRKKNKHDRK